MDRRHFVKLWGATCAAMLFSRVTYAADGNRLVNLPDEVWVQTDSGLFRLKRDSDKTFTFAGIDITFTPVRGAMRVIVQSTAFGIRGIRLLWKHGMKANSRSLGDHWERDYGDASWAPLSSAVKNPWYVLIHDDEQTACFGVRTGCNTICSWTLLADGIALLLDTYSGGVGVKIGNRVLNAADIVTCENSAGENTFATARRFCTMMCEKPLLPKQPVYGINDWYYAYGNNSAELIKKLTAMMAELVTDTNNRAFSVIDAGWAQYSPYLPGDGGWADDFSKPNDKFKDMHRMADDIKALGMRPGLWTRALCAKYNDDAKLLLPKIKGRDDPKNPVLDPTIPENIERVKNNISIYKQWGYELVKHDYSTYDITGRWGFQMTDSITEPGWGFNDKSKTTAEIIKHLYSAIRDAAGDMYLIGCNTLSHLSAGIFEMNRIGDDTSGKEWARTRKMGVNAMGFRMPQHNTFYAVDGDCVGLTTAVPWEKNKQWMQLLAESSAPLFISAQPEALGADQKAFVKQCFAQAAKVQPIGEPLDWMDNPLPGRWRLILIGIDEKRFKIRS